MRRLFALVVLAAALFVAPALVSAEPWNHNVSHEVGNATSIKVVGTEGLKIEINGQTDSTPAIVNLADQNAFVNVNVTAADGKTWSKKIEVKQYHQTVLTVTYVPEAAKDEPKAEAPKEEPKADARSHIGTLKHDTWDPCFYQFMRDGAEQVTFQFDSNGSKDVNLWAGTYELRVYALDSFANEWRYIATDTIVVDRDGWNYSRNACPAP